MPAEVISPITGSTNTQLLSKVDSTWLISEYKKKFEIDITTILGQYQEISVYKCFDSGFTFYYPFDISGNTAFYESLGRLNWYYDPWRWEHEQTLGIIKQTDKVLEIGAGSGAFLKALDNQNISAVGLDLNKEKAGLYSGKNSKLICESIINYANDHQEEFDLVCSFQFLEHVSNVRETIDSMLKCLKTGGKIIIAVPNNDSFIGSNILPTKILNMPPHHLGMWTPAVFKKLPEFYPIELLSLYIEPLQKLHRDTYLYNRVYRLLFRSHLLVRIIWKFNLHRILRPLATLFSSSIRGHSVLVVYEKK